MFKTISAATVADSRQRVNCKRYFKSSKMCIMRKKRYICTLKNSVKFQSLKKMEI